MPVQTRAKPALFDLAGRPLNLGSELGSGGEGAVFELRDRADVVAKLYHKPLEPEKASKIASMAKFSNERLIKLTGMADRAHTGRIWDGSRRRLHYAQDYWSQTGVQPL